MRKELTNKTVKTLLDLITITLNTIEENDIDKAKEILQAIKTELNNYIQNK